VPAKTVQHVDRFAQKASIQLVDRARHLRRTAPPRVGVDQERGPSVSGSATPYALFRVAPVLNDNVVQFSRRISSTTPSARLTSRKSQRPPANCHAQRARLHSLRTESVE